MYILYSGKKTLFIYCLELLYIWGCPWCSHLWSCLWFCSLVGPILYINLDHMEEARSSSCRMVSSCLWKERGQQQKRQNEEKEKEASLSIVLKKCVELQQNSYILYWNDPTSWLSVPLRKVSPKMWWAIHWVPDIFQDSLGAWLFFLFIFALHVVNMTCTAARSSPFLVATGVGI